MIPALTTHRTGIAALCHRFHVRRLDVFGSAVREDDFTSASDVDLLVEFEPSHGTSALGEFLGLREALSSLLGRDVDLTMTTATVSPHSDRTLPDTAAWSVIPRTLTDSTSISLDRHSREGGNPADTRGSAEKNHVIADAALSLDSRFRGNDELETRIP